jgi:DNA repair protein RadC
VFDVDRSVKAFRYNWTDYNIQEHFSCIFLNGRNDCLGIKHLHTGTKAGCELDIRLLFGIACSSLSEKIIIAHNHTNGDNKPSTNDLIVTKRVREACKLFDIELLDHIILTENTHFSFLENKLI